MGETVRDGGPAFPHDALHQNAGGFAEPEPGMSLRDWFAGRALTGLAFGTSIGDDRDEDARVQAAYRMADKMLAERAKPAEK